MRKERQKGLPMACKEQSCPTVTSGTFWFSGSVDFKDMKSETRDCFSLEFGASLITKERPFRDPANLPKIVQLTTVSRASWPPTPGLKCSYVPMHSFV